MNWKKLKRQHELNYKYIFNIKKNKFYSLTNEFELQQKLNVRGAKLNTKKIKNS